MEPKQVAEDAIKEMNKRITDEIFLIIQNDKRLMNKYLRAVEKHGLDAVNQIIGKTVKKKYNLTNRNEREKSPKSTLIKSFKIFN